MAQVAVKVLTETLPGAGAGGGFRNLVREVEPGTDVCKVITNGKNVDCSNLQVLSEI